MKYTWAGIMTIAITLNAINSILWLINPMLTNESWRGFAPIYIGFVLIVGSIQWVINEWKKISAR